MRRSYTVASMFRDSDERLAGINEKFLLFDYVRYRILGLCAEEIIRKKVPGNVAEAGVFKGEFASVINSCFANKKLFLYDTFSGFVEKDILQENDPQSISKTNWYNSINRVSKDEDLVETIKAILPHPEQAIFRKGYFPETATVDQNQTFCFVSIDMDIYLPTFEALKFFWPRMEQGGYIFIHDGKYDGVQRAIHEFSECVSYIPVVPICDRSETYIVCKV